MTLSNSRQQFLSCETHSPEPIQYGRKGGIFITHCICVAFVICAIVIAVIVGVIAHFITYFKVSYFYNNNISITFIITVNAGIFTIQNSI